MPSRSRDDLIVTPPPRLSKKSASSDSIDVDKLQGTLDKVVTAVNRSARHTAQIPEIKAKVESTSEKVITLDTKMDGVTERVAKVEEKTDRPHSCYNIDVIAELKDGQREASQKIETDVQKGVAHAAVIDSIKQTQTKTIAEVEDIKRAPRRLFFGLVGLVVTMLTLLGGGIWFLAELGKDVEFERTQREQQLKRIESSMRTLGDKADPAPVQQALEDLEDEIEESSGSAEEYNALCEGMLSQERRVLRKVFTRRNKRVPVSCLR